MAKINGELVNNLGNFMQRVTQFAQREFVGEFNLKLNLNLKYEFAFPEFQHNINREIEKYITAFETRDLKTPLQICLHISQMGNQFWQKNKPWVSKNHDVIGVALSLVCLLHVLLQPYMPDLVHPIHQLSCDIMNYRVVDC